jgi:hypothetical protein
MNILKQIKYRKHPKYKTEAERKEGKKKSAKRYNSKHKDIILEYDRQRQKEAYRKKREALGFKVKAYNKIPKATQTELLEQVEFLKMDNKKLAEQNEKLTAEKERIEKEFRNFKSFIFNDLKRVTK